ncbi:MAG: type II toxin-antitoxin system RelE/ParE family toxin [Chloroflexi bacterium]|nr:type II toxin-antitoxin system RelE/ParE family toxin [Chloroflexota bacterium]
MSEWTTGRSQHRVLYFAAPGRRLVLLHAFTKKTPKTPPAEIKIAMRRMADYQSRMSR